MSSAPKTRRLAIAVALGLALNAMPDARAQSVPDAGQILREQPGPAPLPTAQPLVPRLDAPAADTGDTGPRVRVNAVRVTGATLLPTPELEALLADLSGRELSFGALQRAALRLTEAYVRRGYLARAYLPPQDVVNGQVEIRVVEGRRGRSTVDSQGARIDPARVQAFVDHRLPQGAPMDVGALGEALNILNEQPGADVGVALSAGAGEADVDLRLSARDGAPQTYGLAANNHASRGVGTLQVVGSATLNNPTGRFDAASLLLSLSEGSAYLRGDYGLPLGYAGTRVKAHAAYLDYRLVQDSFRALDARGTATTLGWSASHPLARRSTHSATLAGGFEIKQLTDNTAAGETGNRRVQVAQLGVSGSVMAPAGDLDLGLMFTAGDSDQRNAAARAADQAGRRTQGAFAKLSLNLGWRQRLADNWVFGASGRSQWADGNLDSSEQFFLGGVGGVRAYPVGEAVGDEGWLLNVDLGRRFGDRLLVSAFIDGGEITLSHTPPPGPAPTRNRYSLAGAGVSLDWQLGARTALRVVLAVPLGDNPAAEASGSDADGRPSGSARLWASVTTQF